MRYVRISWLRTGKTQGYWRDPATIRSYQLVSLGAIHARTQVAMRRRNPKAPTRRTLLDKRPGGPPSCPSRSLLTRSTLPEHITAATDAVIGAGANSGGSARFSRGVRGWGLWLSVSCFLNSTLAHTGYSHFAPAPTGPHFTRMR